MQQSFFIASTFEGKYRLKKMGLPSWLQCDLCEGQNGPPDKLTSTPRDVLLAIRIPSMDKNDQNLGFSSPGVDICLRHIHNGGARIPLNLTRVPTPTC